MSSTRSFRELNFSPVGVVLQTLIGNLVCSVIIAKNVSHKPLGLFLPAFELIVSESLRHALRLGGQANSGKTKQ